MEKLDRLDWTANATVTSYGVHLRIRSNDPEALNQMLNCLPPDWTLANSSIVDAVYSLKVGKPGRNGERPYNLLKGSRKLTRTMDLKGVLTAFEFEMHPFIAEISPQYVFVHAGVVALHGNAILIPGRSFAGKSTLVAELVKAGATYYSDEFAVLDALGRVHPYHRPISLRGAPGEERRKYRAEELGGVVGDEPLPVGLVLVTKYQAGANWKPRRLSAGRGVLALLENTVPARRAPERVFAALHQAVEQASILKSRRGEASEIVGVILARASKIRHSSNQAAAGASRHIPASHVTISDR